MAEEALAQALAQRLAEQAKADIDRIFRLSTRSWRFTGRSRRWFANITRRAMALSQSDVLDDPIPRASRALPSVAILQSDLADTGHEHGVARLAPRAAMPTLGGRLIPIVEGQGRVRSARALTDRLAVMDLRHVVANLADDRERILAALGYLFIGF